MITKEGYVFIARMSNGATPIFGRAVEMGKTDSKGIYGYMNITMNEITLFDEEQAMRENMQFYNGAKPPELVKLIPAELSLRIAQSVKEADKFRRLTDLVAIRTVKESSYVDTTIYGPINRQFMDLHQGVLPCHRIDGNGLLTFKRKDFGDRTFDVAMEARYQAQRQSEGAPTLLATFKLKKLRR